MRLTGMISLHRPASCRNIAVALGICLVLPLCQCATHKKVVYNIPAGSTKDQKAAFLERMEKGAELYKANCGACHGIFNKGKDKVPDFTHEQVDNYSAAYLRGDPKNHAVAAKLSTDQFMSIMNFLSSRKVDTTLRKTYTPPKPEIQFR